MKQVVTLILLAFICICGYAQTIDPALLQEMGQLRNDEKIKVFVVMRQQYDQQQLNRTTSHFTTRAARREFVVNELKQFAEASQYNLRHSLEEMQRKGVVSEPQVLWIANAIFFEATIDAILSLADRSDVMVIGFDKERNWLPDGEEAQPANPTREITSNVTQVNADQVWSLGYTGQGVVVAVIDTGVNYNHLDLADHLWDGGPELPYHGYDVFNNDNDPMDDHGHGTHCAGTVCGDGTAGSQTGMAPDATLMIVKCLGADGTGSSTQVLSAMQWAVEHDCDVISMSLGGHGDSNAEQTITRNTCVNVLIAGVIASIAAGNEGDQLGQYPVPDNVGLPGGCPPPYLDPQQALNPGGLSCSVCVGAVDSDDQAACFTSHGPRDWSNSDYADYPYTLGSQSEFGLIRPDVCAPGVSIKSASYNGNNGYTIKSGTSMATPCVAGCMALMLSKNNNLTPADVCRILEETAVPLSTGKSNFYGYGRVDVLAAINTLYSGPLTLESFAVNDEQGNNDGHLNAGETVTLDLTFLNDSDTTFDGATLVLSSISNYVTIMNETAILPHFDAGQTQTVENIFAFSLSDDAPGNSAVSFYAEVFMDGESTGIILFSVMVYGPVLRFDEVIVLNDDDNDGSLEPGETADLHVVISNIGNETATSIVGTLSTAYPQLTINNTTEAFGTIEVNGQAYADFNVTLSDEAPDTYSIVFLLDLVGNEEQYYNLDFELEKGIIVFADPYVKAICVDNWDSNGDGKLSYSEAAAVINLDDCFKNNTDITSFDELQFFIGLSFISGSSFHGCSSLMSLFIPNSVTTIGSSAFYGCSGLTSLTVLAETPPTLNSYSFYGCSKSIPVYVPCGSLEAYQSAAGWNEFANIQEVCSQQTISFYEGWNWTSFNIDITLDELKEALVAVLPGTAIMIRSHTQNTSYNPNTQRWSGSLTWDVAKMYLINTAASCEITLEGTPINPAEHPIIIVNGVNWIAFPLRESMSISDVFAGFAVNGDKVKSQNNTGQYQGGSWRGQLNTLEPGMGYMYISNTQGDRTLIFPTNNKKLFENLFFHQKQVLHLNFIRNHKTWIFIPTFEATLFTIINH